MTLGLELDSNWQYLEIRDGVFFLFSHLKDSACGFVPRYNLDLSVKGQVFSSVCVCVCVCVCVNYKPL